MAMELTSTISYNHSVNELACPKQDIFEFYSGNPKNTIGKLVCHKSEMQFRPDYNGQTLAIDYLETTVHNQGDGTRIIKFAQDYSKKTGCNGYIVLKADPSIDVERIPHVFYRKMGFTTQNKKMDKKLDKLIKHNKTAKFGDFSSKLMVFPPPAENI